MQSTCGVCVAVVLVVASAGHASSVIKGREKRAMERAEAFVSQRREAWGKEENPFEDRPVLRVLLLGLDARVDQTVGHCDVIQFIEIDSTNATIDITAVPRGTYSPLPSGTYAATDYYLSNACAIGGVEYGISQIEKLLGRTADYVVLVNFSGALHIFRTLGLPASDTLAWLRHRQSFPVGEPQRAHNHSVFLKDSLARFEKLLDDKAATPLQYLLYRTVKTDMTFAQARVLAETVGRMDTAQHEDRVRLYMIPAYPVADIPFDPARAEAELAQWMEPIRPLLHGATFTGATSEEVQEKVVSFLRSHIHDPAFVRRALAEHLWLSIDDEALRDELHAEFLRAYLPLVGDEERLDVLADYLLEMEEEGKEYRVEYAKEELTRLLAATTPYAEASASAP